MFELRRYMYFIKMLDYEMSNFKNNFLKYQKRESSKTLLLLRRNIYSIKNLLDDVNRFASNEIVSLKQIKRAEDFTKSRLKRKRAKNYGNLYIKQKKRQDQAFYEQCVERKKRREALKKQKEEQNETILQTPVE